jgi:hypothetical protein
MLHSIELRNFRGFQSVHFGGFRQFNLIVGGNATGKTALLEAVFLASANSPESALRLRAWRGLGLGVEIANVKSSYEAIWKDLFFGDRRSFSVTVDDRQKGKRSCRAYYAEEDGTFTLPLDTKATESTSLTPITFEWESNKRKFQSQAVLTDAGLKLSTVPSAFFPSVFLPSGFKLAPSENARRYSDLSKDNREHDVIDALHRTYPLVTHLSVEVDPSGLALYAEVEGLPNKLPVPTISDGINKYLSLLLAIHSSPGGVVLVDEIENGFYYEKFGAVMSALLRECAKTGVQAFMTTHSIEFLRSLSPLLRERSGDFLLLRTRRDELDGTCNVDTFDGQKILSAIEEGFEIR